METFFILFTLVFALFLWYLDRAFQYTNETVGDYSPVYIERTYHFSAAQYFGQFIKFLLASLLFGMPFLVYVVIKAAILHDQPVCFLFAFFFSAFALFLAFFFYVDWLYWLITRNTAITFDPLQPSLTIHYSNQSVRLTAKNLLRIEEHRTKSGNSKYLFDGYGYILLYTTDGQIAQINNIFFNHVGHTEFIERFFKNVSKTIVWHHPLAWPTHIEIRQKSTVKNFAAQH